MSKGSDKSILAELLRWKGMAEADSQLGRVWLYQQVGEQLARAAYSKGLVTAIGDSLIATAEHAYALRQVDKLNELSKALLALPLPRQYVSAGQYFRGLQLIRRGELDAAKSLLEEVAAGPSQKYTARAMQSIGVIFHIRGDFESATKIQIEAGRRAADKGQFDLLTEVSIQKNLAVLKSVSGDHLGALTLLHRNFPFARAVSSINPALYYDYQNSLAVEFGELGRLAEAVHASRIALSSRCAVVYPEWRETFDEIAAKQQRASRSAVRVRQTIKPTSIDTLSSDGPNLVRLPVTERSTTDVLDPHSQPSGARVLNFEHWKTALKTTNPTVVQPVTPEQRRRMTTGEKLIRLMDLISHDETDDETIDRILEAVERIILERRAEKLD